MTAVTGDDGDMVDLQPAVRPRGMSREQEESIAPRPEEELRCEVLTDFADLEALAGEWDRLWANHPARDVFTSFAWARRCWEVNASERRLFTPVVYEGSRVVAVLPLALQGRTLIFIGHGHSDYNDILVEGGREADAVALGFRRLLRSAPPWRACVLANVPEDSVLFRAASRLPADLRTRLVATVSAACPKLRIDEGDPAQVEGILKKNKLKYYQNRLENLGKLAFRHLETPEEIAAHLPSFFHQYRCRRALAGDLDRARHERLYRLLGSLTLEIDPALGLRFSVLELDGRPIAYHFGFESEGRLLYYKPTFDIDYWDYSVGQVLLKKILEYARAQGLREVDFTVGDEDYKSRFTNHRALNYTLTFHRSATTARLHRAWQRAKSRIREDARLSRALESLAGGVRDGSLRFGTALRRDPIGAIGRAARWIHRRDEVLVYSRDPGPSPERAGLDPDGLGLGLRAGSLRDLAALALEYPESLTPAHLHEARKRLKGGDRLFLAIQGDRIVHTCWRGMRGAIPVPAAGPEARIELDQQGIYLFDCWTRPEHRGRGICQWVLSRLCDLEDATAAAWICCAASDRSLRRGVEKAGFRLAYRAGRRVLAGRVGRTWCEPAP